MTTTIGSFDLASLKNLRDDVTQYFWFESNSSSAWGSGAHVTLYPESQFTNSTSPNYMKGQNIIMNTDGFSIRNGGLPMMVIDNDSLDFNAVDTSLGTYTTMATFGLTGATIGQTSGAHSIIDTDGQRFYASDGTTQLANIGYGEGNNGAGALYNAPFYTFGTRASTATPYSSSSTYEVGDLCTYDDGSGEKIYVCTWEVSTPQEWTATHWKYYIGGYSYAEGADVVSCEYVSHAEGSNTRALGYESHAEGSQTRATGSFSHAEGTLTRAFGWASHAQNNGTTANCASQTVIGEYNELDPDATLTTRRGRYAFIIGNGTDSNPMWRSNALTVDWDGNVECSGNVISANIGNQPYHGAPDNEVTTLANNSWKVLGSFKVPAGVSLVDIVVRFNNDSSGTGYRAIIISTNNDADSTGAVGNIATDFQRAVSGNYTSCQCHYPSYPTTETTYYIKAYQNSGSSRTVSSRVYVTRIK